MVSSDLCVCKRYHKCQKIVHMQLVPSNKTCYTRSNERAVQRSNAIVSMNPLHYLLAQKTHDYQRFKRVILSRKYPQQHEQLSVASEAPVLIRYRSAGESLTCVANHCNGVATRNRLLNIYSHLSSGRIYGSYIVIKTKAVATLAATF